MSCAAARARTGRGLSIALSAAALGVLAYVAFRSLEHEVEPIEASATEELAASEPSMRVQVPEALSERDAIKATREESPADSNQSVAARGSDLPPSTDSAEVVVWGYVFDREKLPIEEALVGFTSALGEYRSADVATDGSYSMPGLEPGRWFVHARAQGFVDAETVIEVPAERARLQRDFTLEPRPSLIVRVLAPDGRAFSEADVDPSSGKPRWTALTPIATIETPEDKFVRFNHNGRYGAGRKRFFSRDEGPAGLGAIAELDLLAPLPLFVSLLLSEEVIATQEVPPGSTEVVFVLDPSEVDAHLGELRLTFVDAESHAPIQRATISVAYPGGGMSPGQLDSEGRLVHRHCPPGRYEFSTWVEGLGSSSVSIDLSAGEVVERTIQLVRGIEVSGRCVDELDRPIAGQFAISPLPQPGKLPQQLENDGMDSSVATKDDGTIELRMEAGLWLIQPQELTFLRERPSVPRMGPNFVLDTRSGPVTNLIVKLRPASSVVVSCSGPDPESLCLWFLDEAGLVRSTRQLGSAPRRCELPPGNWQARVVDAKQRILETRDFTLGSEPVMLELGRGQ